MAIDHSGPSRGEAAESDPSANHPTVTDHAIAFENDPLRNVLEGHALYPKPRCRSKRPYAIWLVRTWPVVDLWPNDDRIAVRTHEGQIGLGDHDVGVFGEGSEIEGRILEIPPETHQHCIASSCGIHRRLNGREVAAASLLDTKSCGEEVGHSEERQDDPRRQ